MVDCGGETTKECKLSRFRESLRLKRGESRGAPQNPSLHGACRGTDRLAKKSFLSMIGAKRYTAPKSEAASLAEQRLAALEETLDQNEGDFVAAAAEVGTTPSILRRRMNMLSAVVSAGLIKDEPASPTPARRYFENLSRPWSITSFDANTREVCVDIYTGNGIAHLSSVVPFYGQG